MPYYRHLKTEQPEQGTEFTDPSVARRDLDPKTHTVSFVASEYEKETWRAREIRKFNSGEYLAVPWIAVINSTFRRYDLPDTVIDHYPHLSSKFPGLIAYTKSEEHGVLDRQTAVKPGKYIEEFLKDSFTPAQIADYIAQCKSDAFELKIARSEADIVAIYSQKDCGFTSCMQSKHSPEYNWQRPTEAGDRLHPVAVYGDSDLGVAYLGDIQTKIKARAVVWPDQKIFTRAYGDINTLKHVLRANGYTEGSLVGSRVCRLTDPKGVIMPYIDGVTQASEDGQWIVLDDEGKLSCDNTEGYAQSTSDRAYHDDDDDDGDYDYTCDHCEQGYHYDHQNNGRLNRTWCDSCIDSSQVCQHCERRRWNEDWTRVEGVLTCERCLENMQSTCEHDVSRLRGGVSNTTTIESCGEVWVEALEFEPLEQDERDRLGVSHLCRTCAEHKQVCKACGSLFDSEATACDLCGQAIYCPYTSDLLNFSQTAPHDAISQSWLPVAADGSLWWIAADLNAPHAGHWVKFADGRTCYTPDCGQTLSGSHFDSLDCEGFRRVPDPRARPARPRVSATNNTFENALRDSQWERMLVDTVCHIHDCARPLPALTLGLRASFDSALGEPIYYCAVCASSSYVQMYAREHAITLPPSAVVPFVANESSPF